MAVAQWPLRFNLPGHQSQGHRIRRESKRRHQHRARDANKPLGDDSGGGRLRDDASATPSESLFDPAEQPACATEFVRAARACEDLSSGWPALKNAYWADWVHHVAEHPSRPAWLSVRLNVPIDGAVIAELAGRGVPASQLEAFVSVRADHVRLTALAVTIPAFA